MKKIYFAVLSSLFISITLFGQAGNPPVALNDTVSDIKPNVDTFNIVALDTALDGDSICLTAVYGSPHFSVLNCTDVVFTPDTDFTGKDSCWYVICDTGTVLCDTGMVIVNVSSNNTSTPPVALNDTISSTQPNVDTINIVAIDTALDGDSICLTAVYGSPHFSVLNCSDVVFTPDTNFTGKDSCWYVICDNGTVLCDTGIIIVNVAPNYALWPVAGLESDSAYNSRFYSPPNIFSCYGSLDPYVYFRVENTSINADSILWQLVGLLPSYPNYDSLEVCGDSTVSSGDTLLFSPNYLSYPWRCYFVYLEICLTAYNKYGISTKCDTTCIWQWEGIAEIPPSYIKIYPNPATDELLITATGFVPEQLSLYDVSGKKVMDEKYHPQIDIGFLNAGLYFIEVKGNGFTAMNRFVKE